MQNATTSFLDLEKAGYGADTLPAAPPGATTSPTSSIHDNPQLGKIPSWYCEKIGAWLGMKNWTTKELRPSRSRLKKYQKLGANRLLRTHRYPAADIDVYDEEMAAEIKKCIAEITGFAPERYREDSSSRLLLYRLKKGALPTHWRKLAWVDAKGVKHALEWLGSGRQCLIGGLHPSGQEIRWRDGRGPCEWGRDDLPEVDSETVDRIFAGVADLIETMGYGTIVTKSDGCTSTSSGKRKSLDDCSLHAPGGPEMVLEALKVYQNTDANAPTHNDFVRVLAAIKAALGPDRESYYGEIEEWALEYSENTPEYVRDRWISIHDSELGADYLFALAHKYGFHDDAQADFGGAVGAVEASAAVAAEGAGRPAEPEALPGPETSLERMLERYVWCTQLERYVDLQSGAMLTPRAFNSLHVEVAPFGLSGRQSAEAVFQNHPDACKVATTTMQPGAGPITNEANERGIVVKAVNLWRPSSLVPTKDVTDADVKPWLDHVELIFGPLNGSTASHFLNWWAYVLQRPGDKIGHALVIVGGQGVGKDTVLRPLFLAVGNHNVIPVDTNALDSDFNYFLKGQIVYGQEIITFGRQSLYNRIKPYITNQKTRLAVNEKGMRQWFVPNNQNWIFTSNHENAIALENGDRRFWVHRAATDEPPPAGYFIKLHSWFDAGGTERVFGWLLGRDVSSFDPNATPPMTAAKRTMLDQSYPAPVRWLRGLFTEERGIFVDRSVVTIGELLRATDDINADAPQGVNPKSAAAALSTCGFSKHDHHRVKLNGDVRQLWVHDPSGALSKLPGDQIRERYLSELCRAERERTA